MARTAPLRVIAVALGLSVLSFALGVAGDLSRLDQPPNSGVRVVLRIPPEPPVANAQPRAEGVLRRTPPPRRAGPVILATAAAEAAPPRVDFAVEAELLHDLPNGGDASSRALG